MIKTLLILTLLILLNSGCVSDSSQHYNMNSVQEFLKRPDRDIANPLHSNWDRDLLRRLNDRELLLNQE